jgi:hypothetical protein
MSPPLHHGFKMHTHCAKTTRPAEFKNHPRSGTVVLPSFGSVELLFHLIHFPAHVGHLEFEHFCELSRRAKHVLMLLTGLLADGFGEQKLGVDNRADAAIHDELSRPAAGGVCVNRLLGDLPGAVLVDVVDFAALLVDDAIGRDVGPDHVFYSFEALCFGEIERQRYLCKADLGDGEESFECIMRPVISRPPNIDGNLNSIVPPDMSVQELAKFCEFKSHSVPDSGCSLFSPDSDVFCILIVMGNLR